MRCLASLETRVLLLAMVTLVAGSCQEVVSPDLSAPDLVESPRLAIVDGSTGGNGGFFFLAPMVAAPTYSGTFDSTLSPLVTISALGEPDIVLIPTVDLVREQYSVGWHTPNYELDPAKTYRITVLVGDLALGYADVDVVRRGGQLGRPQAGEFVGVRDGRTLPIKFRIEEGAVPDFPSAGLVAWYPFNASPEDVSGQGHDLSEQDATYVTDRFGAEASSAAFTTLSAQMTTQWGTFPLDDLTISLWFRIDGPYEYNSFAFLEYGRPQAGPWQHGLLLAIGENWRARSCPQGSGYGIAAIIASSGVGLDNGCLPYSAVSSWNHMVVTASGGTADAYLNGVHRGSFQYEFPIPTSNSTLWVGNLANYQSGLTTRVVDDLGVWDRVLSVEEIGMLYGVASGGAP